MVVEVSRDEVREMSLSYAQLVDVRPDTEFRSEHIAGAISLPLKTLDASTASRVLSKDRAIVVY